MVRLVLPSSFESAKVYLLQCHGMRRPIVAVCCAKEKELLFQQAANDARALLPFERWADVQKDWDESYTAALHPSAQVTDLVKELAQHLESLDDKEWSLYCFTVCRYSGHIGVGIGSNAKKRERASYAALAVTALLAGGNPGNVSAELQSLASVASQALRAETPQESTARPTASGYAERREAEHHNRSREERPARSTSSSGYANGRAEAESDLLPPWMRSAEEESEPLEPPWSRRPEQEPVPSGSSSTPQPASAPEDGQQFLRPQKKKANKISGPELVEPTPESEGEDGDEEIRLSQPLFAGPSPGFAVPQATGSSSRSTRNGGREDDRQEQQLAEGLRKASSYMLEDAQTINTMGTDDIPLGTDTDPNNYRNLWLSQSTRGLHSLLYGADLDTYVMDAENIGYTYSNRVLNKKGFALEGVKMAVKYYTDRRKRVLVVGQRPEFKQLRDKEDDWVSVIVADKIDDAIVLQKAFEKQCPIVSRDEFRKQQDDIRIDSRVRRWYKEKGQLLQVKYTFDDRGEFSPGVTLERPPVKTTWERPPTQALEEA
mmetsp:Transcript_27360/g.63721  ORF Transcript_27360/g.63721 Transcript_27360/m.63721 type:complete len:547 (-) Transcript_27360:140-1780(-)